MDIDKANSLKKKACECITNILSHLESETGMKCQEVFILSESEESSKLKVELSLRLKYDSEVEE